MYDFQINGVPLFAHGELDARAGVLDGGAFLLSHTGEVLAACSAVASPLVGENFFEALGTVKGERDVLGKTLLRGAREPYLMQCGEKPVLLFRLPYSGNLTMLAVIPPHEVAEVLRQPAPYADVFGHRIALSPLSVGGGGVADEAAYRLMTEWLQMVMPALGGTILREERATQVASVLSHRLCALARLSGMLVQYDLSTFSYGTVLGVDDALLAATLVALFFSLRDARDAALHVTAVRDAMGEPRLHVRFYAEGEMPTALLETLLGALAPRGMTWECYRDKRVAKLWHISLPMCAKEISLQQLRNYFGC